MYHTIYMSLQILENNQFNLKFEDGTFVITSPNFDYKKEGTEIIIPYDKSSYLSYIGSQNFNMNHNDFLNILIKTIKNALNN